MSTEAQELAAVLQRRWNVIEALRLTPRSKPELVQACDVSRSTVDRAIDELTEYDICKRDHEVGYRLTPNGRCIVDLSETVGEGFDGIIAAGRAGLGFDVDEPDYGVMFVDAEIVTGEPHAPDQPLQEFCERLRETPCLRGFTPVVLREFVEIGIDRLRSGGISLDLVVTPAVGEYLATEYPDAFRVDVASDRANFHEATLPTSTGLAILGEDRYRSAVLLSYGNGGLEGFVETTNRLAVGWAERVFEVRKENASPVRLRRPA